MSENNNLRLPKIEIQTTRGKIILELFEEVLGEKLIRLIAPSRDGDSAGSFASLEKARTLLSWEPRMSLEQGIADAIKWSRKHTTH